jgi:hypothetical protein
MSWFRNARRAVAAAFTDYPALGADARSAVLQSASHAVFVVLGWLALKLLGGM